MSTSTRRPASARSTLTALLVLVATACSSEHVATTPVGLTCQATRPSLQGTWEGTLDNAQIVLRLEEHCALGWSKFASDRWDVKGSWAWKDWNDMVTGSALTGSLANEFGAQGHFSYLLSLTRYAEGDVYLRIDSLPAGSTITAHVSGSWRRPFPLVPPPGPIVLRRR